MGKTRTITLTGRAPVQIDEDQWPVIASARWYSGEHECQANEVRAIRVRRHEDGRSIVYGSHDSGPGGMHVGFRGTWAGELVPSGAGVEAAIMRVAEQIGDGGLGQECIADLPAVRL